MSLDNETWSNTEDDALSNTQEPISRLVTDDSVSGQDTGEQQAIKNLERRRMTKRREKRIKIAVGCALAGGIIAALIGRSLFSGNAQANNDYKPETTMVERKDFSNVVTASGTLKAGSTVMVTPEVDGIVENVLVSEGQTVKEGDVLFTLKNDALDKAVSDADREVKTAEQALATAQTALSNAQASRDDVWARYNEAWDKADAAHAEWAYQRANYSSLHAEWESRKATADALACSQPQTIAPNPGEDSPLYESWVNEWNAYNQKVADYEAYQAALALVGDEPQMPGAEPTYPDRPDDIALVNAVNSAEDAVTTADTNLTKAREAYDAAVKEADKRTVKAPSGGNVVSVGAKVGASVTGAKGATGTAAAAGSGEALVQISDVKMMAVDVEVNEIDILNVRKGQWAIVTFSAVPDVEVDALVNEVATVASSSSNAGENTSGGVVTFHVGLVIPKPDKQLRGGMTANVKIVTDNEKDALVVPSTAIVESDNGTTVNIVVSEEDDQVETVSREVAVGIRGSKETTIKSGVAEGETILVSGGANEATDDAA